MPRRMGLSTRMWTDLSLEELAQKANEWGYQSLEVAISSEQVEISRLIERTEEVTPWLQIMEKHELRVSGFSVHTLGQAVGDRVDERHQAMLPKKIWGNGEPEEVSERAGKEILEVSRLALQCGVNLLTGAMGSTVWPYLFDVPPASEKTTRNAWKHLVSVWKPVLDGLRKAGIYYALEPGPGQPAFDLYSAESMLQHFDGHDAIVFAVNPGTLHWQGVDPVEFIRAFPDRIAQVYAQDAALTLNGRSGILGSHLPLGDPRRGWAARSPGHGNVDWPGLFRSLNQIAFDGPITVLCDDPDMDRDYSAADALPFLRRMDIEPATRE